MIGARPGVGSYRPSSWGAGGGGLVVASGAATSDAVTVMEGTLAGKRAT
jgi:hypothetical protein